MTKEELLELLEERGIRPNERQTEVLTLRFGLDRDGETRSLEETAQLLGITRERVRQIEASVLRRPVHLKRAKPIRDFYT